MEHMKLQLTHIEHQRSRFNHPVSAKNDNINNDATYLVQIHGRWHMGGFSEQWYGWNFQNWGTSGIQLDLIDKVYEVDGIDKL